MRTSRRGFLHALGAGAAGLGLGRAAAQTAAKPAGSRLKMVMRADDVGYTNVCNIGAFETIERGVVTSADVMLDTPGTVDALERLRALPWISVGWHAHFWGSPVLDPSKVPSMVIREDGRVRFRKDLASARDVVFEEALAECRAQLDRCVKILGRVPDTGGGARGDLPFGRAIAQAAREYGLVSGFAAAASYANGALKLGAPADKRWADRKIYMADAQAAYRALFTDSLTEIEKYDPLRFYLDDPSHILDLPEGSITVQVWHPGYVDYYVYRLGDYGPNARNFITARTKDVEVLCSERLKSWIKEHRIELVNHRDALYGTNEYQNHLRATGNDLCMV